MTLLRLEAIWYSLALDLSTMEDRGGERELVARLADLVTALR